MNPPLAIAAGLLICGRTLVPVRANSREGDPFDAKAALARCTEQLRGLGQALAAYHRDHGELPSRLSDLYPRYVSAPALFHCPADAAQGRAGAAGKPGLVVSYNYDMSLDRSPGTFFQLGPERPPSGATWRQEKLLQRIQFGDRVSVVICLQRNGSPPSTCRLLNRSKAKRRRPPVACGARCSTWRLGEPTPRSSRPRTARLGRQVNRCSASIDRWAP